MLTSRKLKGAACAAVVTATAFIVSPPADAAVPVPPVTDNVFILPGASPDAWAPRILGRIDPWATDNPRVRKIDADYYSCSSPCNLSVIRYPRTAGPLFGPNAPYADESIATGVDLTKTAIHKADGQMVVAGLSLGSITADAVQRSIDADPNRPPPDQLTFIVSGDPSRVTPFSTGIGSFLPVGFRIPVLGWTVTRPPADSPYDTVVVVGEYDVTADFPDRPWNLLAVFNSLFGFEYGHGASALSSPTEVPKENIRETENDKGATTTTYLVPSPQLPMLKPLNGVLPPSVISAANNVLKPIVDRGYSRNDAANGNRAPYLQPTNGLPRLVMPTRVTHSFKATPNVSALPRLDSALSALDRSTAPKSSPLARVRERSANRLQRLNNLTDSWHPGRHPDPAVAEALS
jgi:PE-PPE domain